MDMGVVDEELEEDEDEDEGSRFEARAAAW